MIIDVCSMIKDGWFMEKGVMWPGQAMSLQVDEVVYHSKSKYQDILVFKSKTYGNVLVLDGVIQVTERDEFSYQEMISHLPMFSHKNPENILVIGGGDGGVLREVLKHKSVKKAVLCEIDSQVIEISKRYLPSLSSSFDDQRVEVNIQDGAEFMKNHEEEFDVIITDSSDPIGPAEVLFEMPFYEAMKKSLRKDGIICSQGECMWLHTGLIKPLIENCKNIFPMVEYAYTCIPTYPSGQIGFIICAKSEDANVCEPVRNISEEIQESLKYYNRDIHCASFVLPQFAVNALK